MDEGRDGEDERRKSPEPTQPPFLEVFCRSSSKIRRFAAGTTAGFALLVINGKLDVGAAPGLRIEALKEGEEPVVFGPTAALVNYGKGWKLQAITDEVTGNGDTIGVIQRSKSFPDITTSPNFQSFEKPKAMGQPNSTISLLYLGKIALAFAFMFLFGGILTFFLENLPAIYPSSVSTS